MGTSKIDTIGYFMKELRFVAATTKANMKISHNPKDMTITVEFSVQDGDEKFVYMEDIPENVILSMNQNDIGIFAVECIFKYEQKISMYRVQKEKEIEYIVDNFADVIDFHDEENEIGAYIPWI